MLNLLSTAVIVWLSLTGLATILLLVACDCDPVEARELVRRTYGDRGTAAMDAAHDRPVLVPVEWGSVGGELVPVAYGRSDYFSTDTDDDLYDHERDGI
jgi:hypothetical protein